MVKVKRFHESIFHNPPPDGHPGWTIKACQEHCAKELVAEGFDMSKPMKIRWNRITRVLTFTQTDRDLLSACPN